MKSCGGRRGEREGEGEITHLKGKSLLPSARPYEAIPLSVFIFTLSTYLYDAVEHCAVVIAGAGELCKGWEGGRRRKGG